jgi:catechol 2,3-dioxygenase-like lactoylglutathione lyase family enzyme
LKQSGGLEDNGTPGLSSEGSALFSHVTVGSADLRRAAQFYDALLTPLGLVRRQVVPDGGPAALCWVSPDAALPRFYVYSPLNGQPASSGNGSMVAFLASSDVVVNAAYEAGIAGGGTSEGLPGERPNYGKGYYGAYLRDPDGNKVHIVHRGDLRRP